MGRNREQMRSLLQKYGAARDVAALELALREADRNSAEQDVVEICDALQAIGQWRQVWQHGARLLARAACEACRGQGYLSQLGEGVSLCRACQGAGAPLLLRDHALSAARVLRTLIPATWPRCACGPQWMAPRTEAAEPCATCSEPRVLGEDLATNPWPRLVAALRWWWFDGWYFWLAGRLHAKGQLVSFAEAGNQGMRASDGMRILPGGQVRDLPAVAMPCPELPACICVADAADWLGRRCAEPHCGGVIGLDGRCSGCGELISGLSPGKCPGGCTLIHTAGGRPLYHALVDRADPSRLTARLCPLCAGNGRCARCVPADDGLSYAVKSLLLAIEED